MGLAQMQEVLARIYTDAELRAQFLADPTTAGAALGLTALEASQLASVSAEQVNRFAQSLGRKRADEVRSLLPFTCRALGKTFDRLFAVHANRFCPRGIRKDRDDAIAFASFLLPKSCSEKVPSSVLDIARYETADLKARQSSVRVVVRVFRHDVRQLIRRMQEGIQLANTAFRPTVGVWMRFGSTVRLCYAVIPMLHRRSRHRVATESSPSEERCLRDAGQSSYDNR